MLQLLAKFVRLESPSHQKAAVDRFALQLAAQWRRRGAHVRLLPQSTLGNHLRAELAFAHPPSSGQILVLGHLDTVYPLGTLRHSPFRIRAGQAFGPGTFDMKGGLVLALFAVDALRALKIRPARRLVFLWTSDEEIGSHASRRIIEREARRSQAVLVLEPSLGPGGKLKTSRKGCGGLEITVTGRSAHAGIDPQKGVNAVHELALQIARLMKMADPRRGITVQSTVASGGTVSNVVPASARAEVDVRFQRLADAPALHRALLALRPILPGARLQLRGGINRPPLERTPAVAKLFAHAQSLMQAAGLPLGEAATGGGSDGNLTAALGIPTLDGLGAVGDGAHSPREHISIRALAPRAALIAALLATL